MAGLNPTAPVPREITLHAASRRLDVEFDDGARFSLPCEYLRVFSPSAEVRGHGGGPMQTVPGKREVAIVAVEPVGHYAVKLVFDDGHASGLYGWDTLYELGRDQAANWNDYLSRLAAAGLSRDTQ
ncbi:gamma-butyrobetaine hydroxylase-like domain-containing protein [Chitinimonas koreensis]|uniref:gamma-butyrobetaine hydroxylase-like domain-containing protein n=1 Tax=Chitinimonas koreensis TaxID=356302 RepID=UPI00048F097C|nr:DUF971 domain-containing protein [Chitinimonas koreensis]QNM96240.1 DUF971 domain-containing protein [Chitinimonas koreensis]